jgi:signal transduction histidine kinase
MQLGAFNIRQKLLLIMISGVMLCAFLGAFFIYGVVQDEIILDETIKLQKLTTRFTSVASQRFLESRPKLEHLAHLLEKQLSPPIKKEEIHAFYALMEKNSAGVWHNRRDSFNAEYETGLFLPPNAKESDQQKVMHLRIKQLFDVVGSVASKRLENVWYLSPFRSEMMFDRNYPDYVFNEEDNADYTQTPWVTYTSPDINPNRELRFTPPLFDPANSVWMVSAVYPIYVNGEWMGSIGEDMQLSDVLAFMFKEAQLYDATQHFLIDDQGNFFLAGDWQSSIEANNKPIKLNFESEPQLAELFQKSISNEPQVLSTDLWIHNKRYVAIGMTISPVNWRYFHVIPVDEMMVTTRQLFIHLLELILIIGVLNGLFTFYFAGKTITNRIKILADTMVIYAKVHRGRIANRLSGNDEIAQLGLVFDNMANEIDQNIETLSHRNELLQSVFDISQSGYLLFDTQEKVLLANHTLGTLIGFSSDSFLEMTASEFWDKLAKQTELSLQPIEINTDIFRVDLIWPQHSTLLCKMMDIVLSNGSVLGKLYLFHDITKEEEANRVKNEFLMHATHELRTPLTAIHGYTELLVSDLIPLEMQPEVIAVLHDQSTWLISMINELLDLSRIEERSGFGFEIAPYLLNDLILEALTEFHIPSGRNDIIIAPIFSASTLNVDRVKFKQVLHNILDNAFKYSPKGGDISLAVYESDGFVEIEIADQGIGISAENRDKVFERFFRVDKSGNIPGIGLGLTIAKEVMHFFNGDIRIISYPNEGSSVILHFPTLIHPTSDVN